MTNNMTSVKGRNYIAASKSIACSMASLLGPTKCVKCVVSPDSHFEFTSNALKLLQLVQIEHPAISLIQDVCQGYHKLCGAGCSTLLFMMGSWLLTLDSLIDQDIPLPIINHLLDEAIQICIKEGNRCSKSVDSLIITKSMDLSFPNSGANSKHFGKLIKENVSNECTAKAVHRMTGYQTRQIHIKTKQLPMRIVRTKYSRHMIKEVIAQKDEDRSAAFDDAIRKICFGVSRGNSTVANLLIRVLELNRNRETVLESLSDVAVSSDAIFTECLNGRSQCESAVYEGLCIIADSADFEYQFRTIEDKSFRVCLLDFDKLHHCKDSCDKDFQRSTKNVYYENATVDDARVRKLLHMRISCVVYKGDCGHFIENCFSCGILALKVSSYKQLEAISIATCNPVVSTVDDLEIDDVGYPVTLSVAERIIINTSKRQDRDRCLKYVVSMQFPDLIKRFATVLCWGPSSSMAGLLEERFWSAVNRIANILKSKKFTPGCGWLERRCMQKLREDQANAKSNTASHTNRRLPQWMQQDIQLYRSVVLAEVANGLERYCHQVEENAQDRHAEASAERSLIIDDIQSKCEAWYRAMQLIHTVSRIDIIVTSGSKLVMQPQPQFKVNANELERDLESTKLN